MSGIAILVVAAFILVFVGVLSLALRIPIERRWFAGTGVARWRAVASGLSWRDRWVLFWANTRGRAAPPRLAREAVERGEVVVAMSERQVARSSAVRRFWIWLAVFWILLGSLTLLAPITLGSGEGSVSWFSFAPVVLGLLTVFIAIGPWQRHQLRLLRRSVEANRRLLREHPDAH